MTSPRTPNRPLSDGYVPIIRVPSATKERIVLTLGFRPEVSGALSASVQVRYRVTWEPLSASPPLVLAGGTQSPGIRWHWTPPNPLAFTLPPEGTAEVFQTVIGQAMGGSVLLPDGYLVVQVFVQDPNGAWPRVPAATYRSARPIHQVANREAPGAIPGGVAASGPVATPSPLSDGYVPIIRTPDLPIDGGIVRLEAVPASTPAPGATVLLSGWTFSVRQGISGLVTPATPFFDHSRPPARLTLDAEGRGRFAVSFSRRLSAPALQPGSALIVQVTAEEDGIRFPVPNPEVRLNSVVPPDH